MAGASNRVRKHYQLDAAKLKRAQKALGASTETETIDLALDLVLTECRKNSLPPEAADRYARSKSKSTC